MVRNKRSITTSIIIRTYNEEKYLGRLLKKIYEQEYDQSFEVIIVDSGSTDNTLKIAAKYPVKIVKIGKDEFSFGRSLNIGIQDSKGKYLVFISGHCWPRNKLWLVSLVSKLVGKNIAATYGKQRGNRKSKFSELELFKSLYPEKSGIQRNNPFCNNANAAVKKDLWNVIRYNENLTGLEDLSWANNILKKGYRIYYMAEAEIIHVHEESYMRIFNRYKREAIALKNIFPDMKFSLKDLIMLFFKNVVSDFKALNANWRSTCDVYEITFFRFVQFFGTYVGFNTGVVVNDVIKKKFYYPN